jgi:hypothetical protein
MKTASGSSRRRRGGGPAAGPSDGLLTATHQRAPVGLTEWKTKFSRAELEQLAITEQGSYQQLAVL